MQKIIKNCLLTYSCLPKRHRIILTTLTVIILMLCGWSAVSNIKTTNDEQTNWHLFPLPTLNNNSIAPRNSEPLDNISPTDDLLPHDEQSESEDKDIHEYTVTEGDTLSSILNQYGIDYSDISLLTKDNPELTNLNIGQQLNWDVDDDENLTQLVWVVSRDETRTYKLVNHHYVCNKTLQTGTWHDVAIQGEVTGNFNSSAKAAGLSNKEIREIIQAMQWQLDFHKLHMHDKFSVYFSRESLGGKIQDSELIAVRLKTGGKDYYAFRADNGLFYNKDGNGLGKGFLRYPMLHRYRVSSLFNPRRLNPVTGRIAPHRGVDFALPLGTPVLSVADGEVVVSKHSSTAGNYIAIRHGRQYMTRYMHLNALLVRPGQKVKRGQRIALSGNTGRSTGPHLHFEIWINNKAVDPLKAKLPLSIGLSGRDRTQFLAKVQNLMPQLTF